MISTLERERAASVKTLAKGWARVQGSRMLRAADCERIERQLLRDMQQQLVSDKQHPDTVYSEARQAACASAAPMPTGPFRLPPFQQPRHLAPGSKNGAGVPFV